MAKGLKVEKIRDYDGRSERRAREIQGIVGSLGQVSARPVIERTEIAQQHFEHQSGFDASGEYHYPSTD